MAWEGRWVSMRTLPTHTSKPVVSWQLNASVHVPLNRWSLASTVVAPQGVPFSTPSLMLLTSRIVK